MLKNVQFLLHFCFFFAENIHNKSFSERFLNNGYLNWPVAEFRRDQGICCLVLSAIAIQDAHFFNKTIEN